MRRCLDFFPGVDRTIDGYEGLLAAQECLPDNETRDAFAAAYTLSSRRHWEALSPDPVLVPVSSDYRWLTQVYESVQPPSGHGKLLWHALGAKTIELITRARPRGQRSATTSTRSSSTPTCSRSFLETPTRPEGQGGRDQDPLPAAHSTPAIREFVELGERLEELCATRHEQGLLLEHRVPQELLDLAKDVVEAEREIVPEEEAIAARPR